MSPEQLEKMLRDAFMDGYLAGFDVVGPSIDRERREVDWEEGDTRTAFLLRHEPALAASAEETEKLRAVVEAAEAWWLDRGPSDPTELALMKALAALTEGK